MLYILKISFIAIAFFNQLLIPSAIVDRALDITLQPSDKNTSQAVSSITQKTIEHVMACDYEKALEIILLGIEQFPHSFRLQHWFATLLGDHSENFTEIVKENMEKKSKECFIKLMNEIEDQEISDIYRFKNEYFFRFADFKNQYQNGIEMVSYCNEKSLSVVNGYYYQGVGAAYYSKQLLIENEKELALEYAQKSLAAWEHYFSYENDYYNSYVHYALALGILGYSQKALQALQHSAQLISRDLTYHEFTEVIEFLEQYAQRIL